MEEEETVGDVEDSRLWKSCLRGHCPWVYRVVGSLARPGRVEGTGECLCLRTTDTVSAFSRLLW